MRRLVEAIDPIHDANLASRRGNLLDDVSAAIDWSLSPEGDHDLAAALAAASAPVWLRTGLMIECQYWLTRVLDAVDPSTLEGPRQLPVLSALGAVERYTDGATDTSRANWLQALQNAKSQGRTDEQLVCLLVVWSQTIWSRGWQDALGLAEQVDETVAALPDRGARAAADWVAGLSHHHAGQLASARARLERFLVEDTAEARQAMLAQIGYDRRVAVLRVLGNLHFIAGRPSAARRLTAEVLDEARRSLYPQPFCDGLGWAALNLHLLGGDPTEIESVLDETLARARTHGIKSYIGMSLAIKGLETVRRGDLGAENLIDEGLELLATTGNEIFHPLFLSELARLKAESGIALSDEETGELLPFAVSDPEDWTTAEVRRNLGEVLLARGDREGAATLFADAADCAERQGALGWSLRIAVSIARAARDAGERRQTRMRLAEVLLRFGEDEDSADLRVGRRLIHSGS